jgi:hypothetical protein
MVGGVATLFDNDLVRVTVTFDTAATFYTSGGDDSVESRYDDDPALIDLAIFLFFFRRADAR